MLKKILLPTILLVLAYGFWVSPDFKTIAAGIAIFLFGMLSLEEGSRAFTGGALERILRRPTSTTGRSLLFGVVSTSLMQSSSLVSVISISFLSAGLITLSAGIGMPEVGIFDSPEPNAFATGMNRNNALVAVSSGLLRGMKDD